MALYVRWSEWIAVGWSVGRWRENPEVCLAVKLPARCPSHHPVPYQQPADPGICPQIQCIHSYLTDQVRQHVLRENLEKKGCVLQGDRNLCF